MKAKAQPCLRDYLTIHVPASTLMGDRGRKRQRVSYQINPLMNKKLQLSKQKNSDVAVIYSSLPNRSFGKRKKLQIIPLLSNIKMNNNEHKVRIIKDSKKTSYDFVFEKDKLIMKPASKQKNIIHKGLSNSSSARSIQTVRPMSQIINRNFRIYSSQKPFDSVYPFQYKTEQFSTRKIQSSPIMEISGSKARFTQSASYWKRHHRQNVFSSKQDHQDHQHDIQIFH